ncbi:MAG TPA: thiamine pyrophosphate-requiring protein [candidate division Zixibacteria bacterium]|nr:thiamine pyrophosphate-requiring protein [candidate division Zixibacteria bacterium]
MDQKEKIVPVASGAEAFLEQFRSLGVVRYLFANTGTDHGPIIEALAKSGREDPRDIRTIVVPHELAAVSMAHGYYNVTGRPQLVLVHTLPGTANALGGLINARSSNVPLFLVAGRTPVTDGELRGGKSQNIHWRQESRDQGALVREFVKWDYELRTNQNLGAVVARAFRIAMSEPRGPVYLTLPREWLCEHLESTCLPAAESLSPATATQADPGALERAADLLLAADRPLIVTKYLGRNPHAVPRLIELAELLAVPVVQQPTYMNFPTDHPLSLGTHTPRHARSADVLFFIDIDVPWEPPDPALLRPDARIIHLDRDPLFTEIPGWGFPAHLPIAACSELALPALIDAVRKKLTAGAMASEKLEERRRRIAAEHDEMARERAASLQAARRDKPINPLWLSKCIGDAIDESTIIVNESVTSRLADTLDLRRPGSLFGTPPAGHLGWGLGAAIGAKLGAPGATVIAAEGDGSYMFAAPTACHFTAQKYGIPFLTVIYNNESWNASINAARGLYPEGVAAKTGNFPGTDLTPSPRFELTAQACGAYAERVEEPDELPAALERALKAVKEEHRQALLNVICKSPLA